MNEYQLKQEIQDKGLKSDRKEQAMKKVFWKAVIGDDIPAVVFCGIVIWTWPKFSVSTVAGAARRMGSISPA